MDKPREFLVLMIPGLTPGRSFTWPHLMQDRDWLPDWKRKDQQQIHVIEKSAYDRAKEISRNLEHSVARLEKQNQRLEEMVRDFSVSGPEAIGKIDRLEKQNEILREALEAISSVTRNQLLIDTDYWGNKIVFTARQALAACQAQESEG